MNLTPDQIIKRPIAMTEKAARLRELGDEAPVKVIFEVDLTANKIQVREAVEALYDVKVTDVNTLIQRGKTKRMGRRFTKRSNWKKAIVTLKVGDDIQFFEESEE